MKWFISATLLYAGSCFSQQDTLRQIVTDVVVIRGDAWTHPLALSTITLDTLALPPASIAPLVQRTPGIWMQSGALNTNRISIRGVGNREPFATSKLKAYLDEIPLTNGVGESNLEDISTSLLSGIRIWRSPASAIWGAGLGGMLQLRSRQPLGDEAAIVLEGGSFGRSRVAGHSALA